MLCVMVAFHSCTVLGPELAPAGFLHGMFADKTRIHHSACAHSLLFLCSLEVTITSILSMSLVLVDGLRLQSTWLTHLITGAIAI